MSDEGDRTCPLCAEEMDLTDQQLKPCKCGYKICVWCWHHIIEMAEREGSEGRCPACRTPYDKERIVRMSAKCERVIATSAEKKQRPQRAKTKASSEARKHLDGVRVIKRNLVYVVGLPSNLADESTLECKEYFGQYGKVLKVSISRPTSAAAAIQQAANTFSVYITYAREEEAIRCIQAVHNFILEGKPLKACFGTTKYCHIWLRNMTCTNPDCLYLHDVGSQEDSFTKDEIISAYTRSRVPQSSNNLQRHSGHTLPPPLDDLCNNEVVSGKNMIKSVSNNTVGQIRGSTNISNGGRSGVLPAAASWGSRVSNCRPSDTRTTSSQNPVKQKVESLNSSSSLLSVVAGTKQTTLHDDAVTPSKIYEGTHALHTNHRHRSSEPFKAGSGKDVRVTASDVPSIARTLEVSAWDDGDTILSIPQEMCVKGGSRDVGTLKHGLGSDTLTSPDASTGNTTVGSFRSAWDDDEITPQISVGEDIVHASDAMEPSVDKEYLSPMPDMPLKAVIGASNTFRASVNSSSSPVASLPKELKSITSPGENSRLLNIISSDGSDRKSSSSDQVFTWTTDCENVESICSGLASANVDSHLGVDHSFMEQYQRSDSNHFSNDMHIASRFQQYLPEHGVKSEVSASSGKIYVNPGTYASRGLFDRNSMHALVSGGSVKEESAAPDDESLIERLPHSINQLLGAADEHLPANFSHQPIDTFENNGTNTALLVNEVSQAVDNQGENGSVLVREDTYSFSGSVKNDILFSSAKEKEANFLGRLNDLPSTDKTPSAQMGEDSIITDIFSLDFDPWDDSSSSNNLTNLLGQINGQNGISGLPNLWKSKPTNQSRFSFARVDNQQNGSDTSGDAHNQSSSPQDMDANGLQYGCRFSSLDGLNGILNNKPAYSSDAPGVARGKVSTPPGFQVPIRAPPPGFSSHNRFGLPYETHPEARLGGNSSFETQYHAAENANDVELIDPAIMAVGKGIMPLGSNNSILGSISAFPPQFGMDGDTGFHLLKQQAIHQNLQIPEHIGDRFSPTSDAYISPRLLEQNHSTQSPVLPMPYQQPIASHVLGSQWDRWNDMPTHNKMGMSEILRNERFGVDSYYPVHDEHAFHRMSSSNLYNRAFGM